MQGAYAEAGNYYRHALETAASATAASAAPVAAASSGGAAVAAAAPQAASSLAVAARYGLALTLAAAGKSREAQVRRRGPSIPVNRMTHLPSPRRRMQSELRAVLAARPEDRSAQRSLAALLASTGAVGEALEHARRAMDASPSDATAAALCASLAAQGEDRASLERCSAACVSAMMRLRGAGCWIPPALVRVLRTASLCEASSSFPPSTAQLCNLGVVALRRAGLEPPSGRAALFTESRKFFEFALTAIASEAAPGAEAAALKTAASIEAAMLSQQVRGGRAGPGPPRARAHSPAPSARA